ncbi:MAG: competence protein TfoX [Bacteroidetes bacterium GWF2_43_63]|nr:MAG: competence protein TfoX [Bacteroidetes bacterium GWE2_42_42]OFY56413.1 MAG: competence protein TfoX [Bacteroidetes bacterium GWF2_43_63]HBG72023.1 competence protein TfoX [Bacteroidales bacterium]HCB63023.1 competence protein TfoX [Bacteroidales bacterium]HCY23242.1 competence protein TfoX [Bacteroidales bacterium]
MAIAEAHLTSLPNIGKTLAELLMQAGIETPAQLKAVGSENAFIRISAIDSEACINKLCALEGAIQGIRWHQLSPDKKRELKEFYVMVKGPC